MPGFDEADQPGGWFAKKKEMILTDFRTGADSTATVPLEDEDFEEVQAFRNGKLVHKLIRSKDGRPLYEYHYSDLGWELRRMYCGNGQLAFEGIVKGNEFYGLSTWWHCNGQLDHFGWRFKDRKFGRWLYFKEDGTPDKEENFGLPEYLDSLRFATADALRGAQQR